MSREPLPTTAPLPIWLRVLVRVDFVAAVALTVLAPLALLARAALADGVLADGRPVRSGR